MIPFTVGKIDFSLLQRVKCPDLPWGPFNNTFNVYLEFTSLIKWSQHEAKLLTFIQGQGQECKRLHICSTICLHGMYMDNLK